MAIVINESGKGKIEARSKNDVTFYYNANKEGVVYDRDGNQHNYKGVVVAIKNIDYQSMFDRDPWFADEERHGIDVDPFVLYYDYHADAYPTIIKAVAYCSVDDKFDLLAGMRRARKKVMIKYYENCARAYRELSSIFSSYSTKMSQRALNAAEKNFSLMV